MNSPLNQIPVWRSVDALVVGSSCGAVAACLELQKHGLQTAIVADGTGFGADLADTFLLWDEITTDPWLKAAAEAPSGASARPGALRHRLEMQLHRHQVPFLFHSRPVMILRQADGTAAGVVFASRTALFAVAAGQVIDCTSHGTLARIDGLAAIPRPDAIVTGTWRIIADSPPEWSGSIREVHRYGQSYQGKDYSHTIYELGFEVESESLELIHQLRAKLRTESLHAAAPLPQLPALSYPAGLNIRSSVTDLTPDDSRTPSGIWLAGGFLPVQDANSLSLPEKLCTVARQVASWVTQAPSTPSSLSARVSPANFQALPAFLRHPVGMIAIPETDLPDWGEWDVIVAGGGTGGAPAAIGAAQNGARTLCLETAHSLGGVGTLGLISSYWFGNRVGFTERLDQALAETDPMARQKHANKWNPEIKASLYHRMLAEVGATTWTHSHAAAVRLRGDKIVAVLAATPLGAGWIKGNFFVDATGNADLAAAAGAPCRLMDSRHAAVQGTGLSPRVYPAVTQQNSDHTFVDDNDPEGWTWAHVQAREKYPDDFDTAPFLNSRERRQIIGQYEVTPVDILAERIFPDTVLTACSNFDSHGFIIHPVFMVAPPDKRPLKAQVPLRCMLPQGIRGVFVTGLGMSAHRDALPVLRMQADVQNQGFVAGWLAARIARGEGDLESTPISSLQEDLAKTGILAEDLVGHADSFPLPDSVVESAARGSLESSRDVAIIMAHPAVALPILASRLNRKENENLWRRCVLILGLLGDVSAAEPLASWLTGATWDEGWDFRGMGQFGPSMSQLDAAVIAAGRLGSDFLVAPVVSLAAQLDANAEFSHCRAVALAAAGLRAPALNAEIERLLNEPGVSGFARTTPEAMLADADPSPISTSSRNSSLREIYLARGLYLGGDKPPRAVAILESYSHDLRGHFARHARSLLMNPVQVTPLEEA